MQIEAVDEFNQAGHLIYSANFIGAFVRGKTREEALQKFPSEIKQYCHWLGIDMADEKFTVSIVLEKQSDLQICDADSDVLFESEIAPLTVEEYQKLRTLAMKSAMDFETLFRSIPIKDKSAIPPRKTFYGLTPATAGEMYTHTKNVNSYYFGEIEVFAENEPDIYTCRLHAFENLEAKPDFLQNIVFSGSNGEQWSLRKVVRRFIWHDRIHAKAMYRAAVKLCGEANIANPFQFEL